MSLQDKTVLVVGAGGLGGYLVEHLARNGINLVIMDGDVFSESNMNRQLYCTMSAMGKSKAEAAAAKAMDIGVNATAVSSYFSDENTEIVKNADAVADCTDNVKARLLLAKTCERYGKTLFHGAINGDYGQIAVVTPGSDLIKRLYESGERKPAVTCSVVPCVTASLQADQIIRYFEGKETVKGVLLYDAELPSLDKLNF